MLVVLDTNVLISALLTPGRAADTILQMCLRGEHSPIINEAILFEYNNVLRRPKFQFPTWKVELVLDGLMRRSLPIAGAHCDAIFPDESDRVFFEAAKTANACVITGNLRHYPEDPGVITPRAFLNTVV